VLRRLFSSIVAAPLVVEATLLLLPPVRLSGLFPFGLASFASDCQGVSLSRAVVLRPGRPVPPAGAFVLFPFACRSWYRRWPFLVWPVPLSSSYPLLRFCRCRLSVGLFGYVGLLCFTQCSSFFCSVVLFFVFSVFFFFSFLFLLFPFVFLFLPPGREEKKTPLKYLSDVHFVLHYVLLRIPPQCCPLKGPIYTLFGPLYYPSPCLSHALGIAPWLFLPSRPQLYFLHLPCPKEILGFPCLVRL